MKPDTPLTVGILQYRLRITRNTFRITEIPASYLVYLVGFFFFFPSFPQINLNQVIRSIGIFIVHTVKPPLKRAPVLPYKTESSTMATFS